MNAPNAASLNSPLAVLIHRLEVACEKLDLVVAHYPNPGKCMSGDIGAIALTRDVAPELSSLYCEFSDPLHESGLLQDGPLVDRFPGNPPAVETADNTE